MFVGRISVLNLTVFYSFCFLLKAKPVICFAKHVVTFQHKDHHFCAGSIVKSNVILTSGYCFIDKNEYQKDLSEIKVFVGTAERFVENGTAQTYYVEKVIIHPKFRYLEERFGLALVILNRSIAEDVVNVSETVLSSKKPEKGEQCTMVGWGRMFPEGPVTNDLIFVKGFVLGHESCSAFPYYYSDHFCLKSEKRTGYQGERGGIITCNGELSGICQFRFLDEYHYYVTDVSHYRNWIMNNGATTFKVGFLLVILMVKIGVFV